MKVAIWRAGIGAAAAGGLIAAGVLAPAAMANAGQAATVPAATQANAVTFTVVAKGLAYTTTAKGDDLVAGDTFEVNEADRVGGRRVGTDYVACTAVTKTVSECNATWNFGRLGTIQVGGLDPSTSNSFVVAITGGTGRYAGVSGTVGISFPKGDGPARQVFRVLGTRIAP